ncbi:Peptidyl-prolyl cis-trans isomerase pin4 [Coemansia spiralis]|nr:Peptidyl-prolyl cis-trans isomerase pin4 [Coemansia spiralis]
MSKAVEETLRALERAYIGEPDTGASSPSPVSTMSVQSPALGVDVPTYAAKDAATGTPPPAAGPAADAGLSDSDSGARARPRRVVQSMYGAPPGYTATMGVGGGRDVLGRGRVASGRQRNSIMIPDQLQAAMYPQSIVPTTPLQGPPARLTGAEYALMANMPDDAIPNAIVVKNINFAVKREELLQTIADRGLPVPYAFNYHFEGAMFRGLAFGNFRTPEEAARVIVGLNGVALLGRPLKVEYKKTLPGTAPPPHPNTIAMMTSSSSALAPSADGFGGDDGSSSSNGGYVQAHPRYDQPIPRPRGIRSGDPAERPRSMMALPSAMPAPGPGYLSAQLQQVPEPVSAGAGDMIDLDDPDTRMLYDLVSGFRHNKSMGELEFPSGLNTRQRQIVMLVAERFGLNHETKGDASGGRYIRIYKGLGTLLEGAEVRRRSVASPSVGGAHTPRYGSIGRSRPASMLYPDSMSMGSLGSPPTPQTPHHDPTRIRSYTHSQVANHLGSQQLHYQQPYVRAGDPAANGYPGRASGSYVGYPSRLYQDAAVVPVRQPRGPDLSQNFAARQQIHQAEQRQAQRQAQLKLLQQNRQRRLSSANDEPPAAIAAAVEPAFTIAKPGSRAIPIVNPDDGPIASDPVADPAADAEQGEASAAAADAALSMQN